MESRRIQISTFKATCIAAVREVDESGVPLVVTLRGQPLVVVQPAPVARRLGALRGEAQAKIDLVRVSFEKEWEMNR
jgi:prevent-host-death family protein